jgi:hypothetical protein
MRRLPIQVAAHAPHICRFKLRRIKVRAHATSADSSCDTRTPYLPIQVAAHQGPRACDVCRFELRHAHPISADSSCDTRTPYLLIQVAAHAADICRFKLRRIKVRAHATSGDVHFAAAARTPPPQISFTVRGVPTTARFRRLRSPSQGFEFESAALARRAFGAK